MRFNPLYRVSEASLVMLMFTQAMRFCLAELLTGMAFSLRTGQVTPTFVYQYGAILAAACTVLLANGRQKSLPGMLALSAVGAAVLRLLMSLPLGEIRFIAGAAVAACAGVYFVSHLRANWRTWITGLVIGLMLDQLLRASSTYDLSLQPFLDLPAADVLIRIPGYALQAVISAALAALAWFAWQQSASEVVNPGKLNSAGGLAFGGFLALETIILSVPGAAARWAGVPYSGLAFWLMLVSGVALMPGARLAAAEVLQVFSERMRGLIWLFSCVLAIVFGQAVGGYAAGSALILAQCMAMLLLWWLPTPPQDDHKGGDQSGAAFSLGLLVYLVLIHLYSFSFMEVPELAVFRERGLVTVFVAAVLLNIPHLLPRGQNPWLLPRLTAPGAGFIFSLGLAVAAQFTSHLPAATAAPETTTLRAATYNINGGYDGSGTYQLDLIARTIEASEADIVVVQEAAAGLPASYSVDQAVYLARQLGMQHAYHPVNQAVQGIAILSRLPFAAVEGAPIAGLPAGAIRVTVQEPVTGRVANIVGAQLATGQEDVRLRQYALLLPLIAPPGEDEPLPTIFAVDLNADEADIVYEQIVFGAGYVDPDLALGIEGGFTTPAENPSVRQQFVFVRGLTPLAARQVQSTASDHRLVVIEAAWP